MTAHNASIVTSTPASNAAPFRRALLTGAALCALAAVPALAQTAGPGPQAAGTETATADAGTPSLSEIIITGQRRSESLQQAPVAVNVMSAADIENAGVERPGDFLAMASNVTFVQSNHPGELYVTVRGNTQTRLGESSVALVVDGVQQLDQNSVNQELFDLQQIEVLKGPQGALYGRNAIGGAIVIRTKDPNAQEYEGLLRVGVANGKEGTGQAVVSGPIIRDKLAFRAGVSFSDRNGYRENEITGEDVDRFRDLTGIARVTWTPTEKLTLDANFRRTEMEGGGIAWNSIIEGLTVPIGGFSGDNTSLPYVANIPGYSNNDRTVASLKADYDLGPAILTSVTSFARIWDDYGADSYPYLYDPAQFDVFFPGATPIGLGAQTQALTRDSKIWYQEGRVASPSDQRFRWLFGAYYAEFDITNTSTTGADRRGFNLGVGPWPFGSGNQTLTLLYDTNDNKAHAFFGNVSFDILDNLEISGALRYDKEKKNQTDLAFKGPPDPADPKQVPGWQIRPFRDRSTSFDELQPKVTLRYEATETLSVYGSWGRGFKTGGFNPFGTGELLRSFNPNSTVGDVFAKEVADTYEIGAKSEFLDRRVRLNVALFQTDTKNAQLLEFFPQGGLQAISTADKVEMKGVEADINILLTEGLQLQGGFGYLDSEVTKFASNPGAVGNQRPSTSKWTANAAIQYTTEVTASGIEATARVDYNYQGTTYWDWLATPGAERSPYSLVNARLSLGNDQWSVAIWSKNLFDKKYNAEHIVLLPGVGALYRAAPRTYGIEASYRF
ncbi:MAG TPA: TonB-dependent receptor [Azospirillaceae bacterium]|nr:TonB-dependent receptor [Azospirillaceae bacterium]